jgi:hypothetical protein
MKSGDKHWRLTAVKIVGFDNEHALWEFKCDCGNFHVARASAVSANLTKSCGCFRKDTKRAKRAKVQAHFKYWGHTKI